MSNEEDFDDPFDFSDPTLPINRLVAAWPRLFHGAAPEWSYVEDGWFDLAMDLCRHLDELLTDDEAARFSVEQIKEKFGGLRFYVRFPRPREDADEMDDAEEPDAPDLDAATRERVLALIQSAEDRSSTTCLRCGQPGTKGHFGGWVATLCPTHAAERERQGRERQA